MKTIAILTVLAAATAPTVLASPVARAAPDADAHALEARLVPGGEPGVLRLELSGGPPRAAALLVLGDADPLDASQPLRPRARRVVWLDADGTYSTSVPESAAGTLASFGVTLPDDVGRRRHVAWSRPVDLGLGVLLPPPGFQRGTVIVTEFMKDPLFVSDASGEWLELYNPTSRRIDLEGMTLSDGGSNSHTISVGGGGLFLRPGRHMVLGNNDDSSTNGFVDVRYRYSGFTLANGSDSIILTAPNGVIMDRVDYDDGVLWPDDSGKSISLDPASTHAILNDSATEWCHSSTLLSNAGVDTGTPGAPNDACP